MRSIDHKRHGLAATMACLALAGAGLPLRAQATPIESYGRLPDLEDVGISPDGTQLAYAGVQGETRYITVVAVGAAKPSTILGLGKAKLRSLSWIDSDHLLIVASTTSDPPIGVIGAVQEYHQGFVYELSRKKLTQLQAKSGDSLSLNVIQGRPFVRTVDGRVKVFFQGVTFVDRIGEPSLFSYDVESGSIHAIVDAQKGLRGYMLDANGVDVARSFWVQGRWTVRVRVGGDWRNLPAVDAPDGPPTMMGLGPRGKAVLFLGQVEGKGGWHALSLENGGWQTVNYAADALIVDPRTGLGMGLERETDHYVYSFFDENLQQTWTKILKAFPGEQVDFVSISDDRKKIVVKVFGQTNGAAYMLVDMNTGHADLIGDLYKDAPPEQVADTRTVSYTAGDGLQIPAYLTLPKGRAAKNLPLIVLPHDGPTSRDELEFDWMAQALASRGYAVLQPQVRGSTGLSGDLFRAGFGQWGRKMQTDLSDGVRFLAAQGVIDPKRVCIAGSGYGGYAALAGASLDVGVYRCAVSVSGPSDMQRLVHWRLDRRGPDFVGAANITLRYFDRFMGAEKLRDPSYREISPINSVNKISVPVLIIHGHDDTVVPFEQSQRMVDAMKAAGKAVQFVSLPGEDHWLSRSETRQKTLTEMVRFIEANNPADPAPVAAVSQ